MTPRPTGLGWALILTSMTPALFASLAATTRNPTLLWATVLAALALTMLATIAAAALADQTSHSAPVVDLGPPPKPTAWVIRHALPVASHELVEGR